MKNKYILLAFLLNLLLLIGIHFTLVKVNNNLTEISEQLQIDIIHINK